MFKTEIIIILTLLTLLILLGGYHYLFHIYEIDYRLSAPNLYADYKSEVTIEVVPLNSLGFRAPFRDPKALFIIEEGKSLVQIIKQSENKSSLTLRSLGVSGTVIVRIKSAYAIFPSVIEIKILTSTASENFNNESHIM